MNPSITNLSKTLLLCGLVALAAGCSQRPIFDNSELSNQELNHQDLNKQVQEPADFSSTAAFEECLASLAEPLANANNPATYHLGAKYALACLEEAPAMSNRIVQVSVMQVHALAISQFLKAGDINAASQQLRTFKSRFPNQDLLLEDGASFIHTVELAIGLAPKEQSASNSLLNASSALKSELRRQQYWQVN
jgi:hypothetical protein